MDHFPACLNCCPVICFLSCVVICLVWLPYQYMKGFAGSLRTQTARFMRARCVVQHLQLWSVLTSKRSCCNEPQCFASGVLNLDHNCCPCLLLSLTKSWTAIRSTRNSGQQHATALQKVGAAMTNFLCQLGIVKYTGWHWTCLFASG